MARDPFDGWLEQVRDGEERAIARERRVVAPDFAAMVAAAHARHPELVSEAAVAEANALAPVIELGADPQPDLELAASDTTLDGWIAAARAEAEADVAARRLAGVPPLPVPAAEPAPRRPWWPMAVAVAAVLAGLGVAIPRLLDQLVADNYQEATTASQAEYLGPAPSPERGLPLHPAAPEPGRTPPQEAVVHPADEAAADPQPRRRDRTRPDQPASPDRLAARLAALDAEAQARWAEGDLAGAEQRFRAILELAGTSRYADLAYGDLFTLAHLGKDEREEQALWREYLRRFPKGRFADDARAGLCRRAPAEERSACWRAYLDDFPTGVHARVARDGLAADAPALEPAP